VKITQFTVRPGFRLRKDDAEPIGHELLKIEADHGGRLLPGHVVEAAAAPSSPLHGHFEWDDTEAAHKYRLTQATYLCRAVQVVITDSSRPQEPIEVRAFFNVTAGEDEPPSYVNVRYAMSRAELRQQVIDEALAQAEGWRERYGRYKELAEIGKAITLTKRRTRKAKAKAV
jgi:hypothetical protein